MTDQSAQFTELYALEQTVDVNHARGRFRVEVFTVMKGGPEKFAARYYHEVDGGWKTFASGGWLKADTIQSAVSQARDFLRAAIDASAKAP